MDPGHYGAARLAEIPSLSTISNGYEGESASTEGGLTKYRAAVQSAIRPSAKKHVFVTIEELPKIEKESSHHPPYWPVAKRMFDPPCQTVRSVPVSTEMEEPPGIE
jgi:hypothetical protein